MWRSFPLACTNPLVCTLFARTHLLVCSRPLDTHTMAENYQCPSRSSRESCGTLARVKGSWRFGPLLALCRLTRYVASSRNRDPTRYLVACLVKFERPMAGEPALAYGPSCQTRGSRSSNPYPLAFRPFAPSSLKNPALLTRTTLRFPAPAGSRFGVSRCCKTDIATLGTLCQNRRSEHVFNTAKKPLQLSDLHKRQIAPCPPCSKLGSSLSSRYLDSDKDTHPCTTHPQARACFPGKRQNRPGALGNASPRQSPATNP